MKKKTVVPIIFFAAVIFLLLFIYKKNEDYKSKIKHLKENSYNINSIDIWDNNDSDLNFLKEILLKDSVRIVLIGEQNHYDGTTFLAKTKLIKYLHEELGFDVLAFESGFYDCNKSWEIIKKNQNYDNGLKYSLYRFWAYSEQFKPLSNYLQKTLMTNDPIQLSGIDNQLTGLSSKTYLQESFDTLMLLDTDSTLKREFSDAVKLLAFDNVAKDTVSVDSLTKIKYEFDKIINIIDNKLSAESINKIKLQFWRNVIIGMKIQINYLINYKRKDLNYPITNERDRQMLENLLWLSDNYFSGRKIMVWNTNYHVLRNFSSIDSKDTSFLNMLRKAVTLGHLLDSALNKKVYTIVTTSYKKSDAISSFDKMLNSPLTVSDESFEYFMNQTRWKYSFVNLRKNNSFLNSIGHKFPTAILGRQELQGKWDEMTDGIFYIETIYKSNLPN